jgi:type I restriction enzyme S subunit
VQPGDAVVAVTDITQGAEVIGRAVRVAADPEFDALIASVDTVIVRPVRGGLTPEFLFAIVSSEEFRQYCRARANGTTVLHLSPRAIEAYPVVLPDQTTIDLVTAEAQPLWRLYDASVAESLVAETLRDELLPQLVSGSLRVA